MGEWIGTLVVEPVAEVPSFSVGELGPVARNAELVVLPGPDSEQELSGSESRSWPPIIEGSVAPPERCGRKECTLARRRRMSSSAVSRSVDRECSLLELEYYFSGC